MSISCRIIHFIHDRVRLRVDLIKSEAGLADLLQVFLKDQAGINTVRMNRTCGSIIMTYDRSHWTPQALSDLIKSLSPKTLKAYRPTGAARNGQRAGSTYMPGSELLFSSAAVALGWVAKSLASPLIPGLLLASALPMLRRAYEALTLLGKLNVDVLDASATALLTLQGKLPTAAVMVWLVNLADYIRDITRDQSIKAISEILSYRKSLAWVVRKEKKVQLPIEQIRVGDTVVVYAGERIPVDGTVISGKAIVDQQILTGESIPVEKGKGDRVYASTVVRDGKLYLHAEQIGQETEAAKIVQLVQEAPAQDTRIQNYAERWADDLVPLSFAAAGSSMFLTGNMERAASLLIIDYGTGIRVAAPTTILASMTKAARRGILVKGGRHVEQLAEIDAIVFDKTGTLTLGNPAILEVFTYGKNVSPNQILALAAGAEQRLSHPVSQALIQAAEARGLAIPERFASQYSIGLGVEAIVGGRIVLVGNGRFMTHKGILLTQEAQRDLAHIERQAASPLCVAIDGELRGVLAYADPLRPEAPAVVQALRQRGVREMVILTGDHSAVARRVAQMLGIPHYFANIFPEEKLEAVKHLQKEGYKVAVVGDGINDSPALAQADVGIAVNGGTEVAQETADVVLVRGGLWKLPLSIDIARESMSLVQQNWKFIMVPNTMALGLAFLGLLGPIGSTLISNGSALLATGNALRPLMNGSSKLRLN